MLVTFMVHMCCYMLSSRMHSIRIRLKVCWHSFDFQSVIFLFSNVLFNPTFVYILTAKRSNLFRVKWFFLKHLLFLCGNVIDNPFLLVSLKYTRLSVVTLLYNITSELITCLTTIVLLASVSPPLPPSVYTLSLLWLTYDQSVLGDSLLSKIVYLTDIVHGWVVLRTACSLSVGSSSLQVWKTAWTKTLCITQFLLNLNHGENMFS